MFSVDGQPSWNVFENTFSNHIPDSVALPLKILAKKFATGTPAVTSIGISDWA